MSPIGKNIEQKKAIEAFIQKQQDPKGFIDSKKGSTKVDASAASASANSFAQRRKMAEEMSQRKAVTEELN